MSSRIFDQFLIIALKHKDNPAASGYEPVVRYTFIKIYLALSYIYIYNMKLYMQVNFSGI